MTYFSASPSFLSAVVTDLAGIGAALDAANLAAQTTTTQVAAAAGDEVSAAIAALFGIHGQQYQTLSTAAATFHAQFQQTLSGSISAYAVAETANTAPLQSLENAAGGD